MKSILVLLVVTLAPSVSGQEREVPKDSVRLSIPGCVEGRTFIVMRRDRPEPVDVEVQPGRRFRMNGKKDMLKEMQTQKATMIEVTGLVRRSQIAERGVSVAGGRVRIGGGQPQAPMGGGGVGQSAYYNEAIFDVESWRSLPDSCPAR
jgi:hypothetical protein